MIALEKVEKLGWTAFDFLVQGPRRFHQMRDAEPDRYLPPIQFALISLGIYQAAFMASIPVLLHQWDLKEITGVALRLPTDLSAPALSTIWLVGILFMMALTTLSFPLAARIVGRHISVRDAAVAVCYSTATGFVLICYLGLALFFAVFLNSISASEYPPSPRAVRALGRFLYIGWHVLSLLLLPYYVSSGAAVGHMTSLRLSGGLLVIWLGPFAAIFTMIGIAHVFGL